MSITEFKVAFSQASNRVRDRNIRLITWTVVALMSGITLFAVHGARSESPQLVRAVGWLAIAIVAVAIVGAKFLAIRLGLDKFERDLTFFLTDKEVIRKREGWPDVQIGLDEIKVLDERDGWLVVETTEPRRTIAIPERVREFESLRAELAKHCAITSAPKRSSSKFITLVGSIVCWGLVLFSKDAGMVMGAGGIALILLAWESSRLIRQLRHTVKKFALAGMISLSWLAAFLVLYLRLVRTAGKP